MNGMVLGVIGISVAVNSTLRDLQCPVCVLAIRATISHANACRLAELRESLQLMA
jgi:hypothetical protein